MARNTGPSQLVRNAVIIRDGFSCRRCGATPGSQIHHRASRQRGGAKHVEWINGKANLILLCAPCHQHVTEHPAEGYATGFLVRRNSIDLPESVPITDLMGNQFFLTDEGSVVYLKREAS